jgi:hypothetical protein
MSSFENLPESDLEKIKLLENILISASTGGSISSEGEYEAIRSHFMSIPPIKAKLPDFVQTCRSLDVFWAFIKTISSGAGSYAERRKYVSQAFNPIIDELEGANRFPGDSVVSDKLGAFDSESVHAVWNKALERRQTDPEGAITVARTLLETVCKRILDDLGIAYTDREDLPKLYNITAKQLNLAPDQHSEEPVKAILGGSITVVHGMATLRNRLSDSHGRGGRPVRPNSRHAHLAVNLSGAISTFLVETHLDRNKKG